MGHKKASRRSSVVFCMQLSLFGGTETVYAHINIVEFLYVL